MSKLAIIIPAFKPNFLDKALKSIAEQTCNEFVVYIGDDASPYDLKQIVDKYAEKITIIYHRFENNLGGTDLVKQWKRCVELSVDEPWIWLFSDDDEMENKCVESFFESLRNDNTKTFFHFNVDVINENGEKIKESNFPKTNLSNEEFLKLKMRGRINSYVVEYIFSRDLYTRVGGFENFDLAWNSDDATWIKMSQGCGIETIVGAKVRWRKSSVNISPNGTNVDIVRRKIQSNISYVKFLNSFFGQSMRRFDYFMPVITWFMVSLLKYKKTLENKELKSAKDECLKILNKRRMSLLVDAYMILKGW